MKDAGRSTPACSVPLCPSDAEESRSTEIQKRLRSSEVTETQESNLKQSEFIARQFVIQKVHPGTSGLGQIRLHDQILLEVSPDHRPVAERHVHEGIVLVQLVLRHVAIALALLHLLVLGATKPDAWPKVAGTSSYVARHLLLRIVGQELVIIFSCQMGGDQQAFVEVRSVRESWRF